MKFRYALGSIFRRSRLPNPKPLILMYHRIADAPADPWGLAVRPARFEEQIEVLRRTRYPLSLADFTHRLQAGTLPPNAVALSFDDGYVDNLLSAKPHLMAAAVPATVFLATGYLERSGEFWWDELGRHVLLEHGPDMIELEIRGNVMRFELGREPPPRESRTWRGWTAPMTKRQASFVAIWEAFRRVDDEERQELMRQLRLLFGECPAPDGSGRAMTADEVRSLAGDGLVTIGAHTITHPILSELGAAACRREVVASKEVCDRLLGANVGAFAYPYGAMNESVRAIVETAGFGCGVCSLSGPATEDSDPMALPRIQIFDWDGDAFERALYTAAVKAHD
jgi:peptidoglycan/xylan/chitin deacetylase (PgdA/CDA1 family)